MTDLEMTKACAEAMGFSPLVAIPTADNRGIGYVPPQYAYCPLHDDAQAMALVKKFRLQILQGDVYGTKEKMWLVSHESGNTGTDSDFNRAIVECVAKLKERP